jgi:hypothetical protein
VTVDDPVKAANELSLPVGSAGAVPEELIIKEARRRHRHRVLVATGIVLLVLALVAGLLYAVIGFATTGKYRPAGRTKRTPPLLEVPPLLPNNWTIVAPGGTSASLGSPPSSLTVLRGDSHKIVSVPAPPAKGVAAYPWAVNGPYIGAITGAVGSGVGAVGTAYAFRPGERPVRLGSASAIYTAAQPSRFWLRQNGIGGTCSLAEVAVTGKRLTQQLALPCNRWLVAAEPGGFVSVPMPSAALGMDSSGGIQTWEFGLGGYQPSPESPLQLWNPLTGNVVRGYAVNPAWIDGVNSQYLVSQSASQTSTGTIEVTDLTSGVTHQVDLPMGTDESLLNGPVLAPQGPYLAWTEVTPAKLPSMESSVSPGCGCAPILTGPGKVRIMDLASGRLVFSRSMTVGSAGAFDWAPDDHYLFVTNGWTTVSVVPTWSDKPSLRELTFEDSVSAFPGTPVSEVFLIATRRASG